jgi:riboflavin synthase
MFTGIVENTAKVIRLTGSGNEYRLTIENPFGTVLSVGDSVSVDGVCLTVEKFSEKEMEFFVSSATVSKTLASAYSAGSIVNLERAMRADGRFDGHIVQGHVDTTGTVASVERIGKGVEISFLVDSKFRHLVVERGSVAVNGISLTCAEVSGETFKISMIPETLHRTTFSNVPSVGRKVNIEFDIIGKYVAGMMEKGGREKDLMNLLEKL